MLSYIKNDCPVTAKEKASAALLLSTSSSFLEQHSSRSTSY